jgi:hypothetical protein
MWCCLSPGQQQSIKNVCDKYILWVDRRGGDAALNIKYRLRTKWHPIPDIGLGHYKVIKVSLGTQPLSFLLLSWGISVNEFPTCQTLFRVIPFHKHTNVTLCWLDVTAHSDLSPRRLFSGHLCPNPPKKVQS